MPLVCYNLTDLANLTGTPMTALTSLRRRLPDPDVLLGQTHHPDPGWTKPTWRAWRDHQPLPPRGAPDRYLTPTDIARRLGINQRSIHRLDLPEPDLYLGNRRGWKPQTINLWQATQKRTRTYQTQGVHPTHHNPDPPAQTGWTTTPNPTRNHPHDTPRPPDILINNTPWWHTGNTPPETPEPYYTITHATRILGINITRFRNTCPAPDLVIRHHTRTIRAWSARILATMTPPPAPHLAGPATRQAHTRTRMLESGYTPDTLPRPDLTIAGRPAWHTPPANPSQPARYLSASEAAQAAGINRHNLEEAHIPPPDITVAHTYGWLPATIRAWTLKRAQNPPRRGYRASDMKPGAKPPQTHRRHQ